MTDFSVQDLLNFNHSLEQNLYEIRRRTIKSVSTDSRTIKSGEIFIALRGQHYDGHSFVHDAIKKGAALCIVDDNWYARHGSSYRRAKLFVVKDTLETLGEIAREYRKKHDIPLIGIAGSNGKTTTKEMIAAVLKTRYNVLYTAGNNNNQIGLPLTLLRIAPEHRVAVVEMGTNHPGEIESLCSIAQQSHALVTNIGHEHMAFLHDRKGVAKEESAIYRTLPAYGIAFINAEEPLLRNVGTKMTKKVTYGSGEGCDVRLVSLTLDAEAKPTLTITAPKFTKKAVTFSLNTIGRHAAYNALAAFTVGFVFQCPTSKMIDALERIPAFDKRMQALHRAGVTIIDDTYNANPESSIAAADSLASMRVSGKKIIVLADMLELGKLSKSEHARVGTYIAKKKISCVLTYGHESRHVHLAAKKSARLVGHFSDKKSLLRALNSIVQNGDAVLIKGSHGMKMEEVVHHLLERLEMKKGSQKK